jgi:hypothetical protein
MHRRPFLMNASAATLAACFRASLAGIERMRAAGRVERRSLGRTGEALSIIRFGGIVGMDATPAAGLGASAGLSGWKLPQDRGP